MKQIVFSDKIKETCPDIQVLTIDCKVKNSLSDDNLWEDIYIEEKLLQNTLCTEDINKFPPILATRKAYKSLGKDPNRYRPSAEALRRRTIRKIPLYKVDTLVDLINLVSLKSGFSIGGFDAQKIDGELLTLGVGQPGEVYHGIGRGELNITGLPVYRDQTGGIGTPTSDEERTKIDLNTTNLFMIINGYSGKEGLNEAGKYAIDLLKKYTAASDFLVTHYTITNTESLLLL